MMTWCKVTNSPIEFIEKEGHFGISSPGSSCAEEVVKTGVDSATPAVAQKAVQMTDMMHCHDNHGFNAKDAIGATGQRLADAITSGQRDILAQGCGTNDLIGQESRASADRSHAVDSNVNAAVDRVSQQLAGSSERGADRFAALERWLCQQADSTGEKINGTKFEIQRNLADFSQSTALNFGEVRTALVGGFKDSIIDSAKNAAAVALAVQLSAKDAIIDSAKNAAAAALAAATNHAAALAQAAECCCEIKELIRADGEKTRDKIASVEAANNLRLFNEQAAKISYLLGKVPTGTPV